jgi:hypothetical protein
MEPVPHILDVKPDLLPEIDEVIQNAMAKDRNKRFATAMEMTSALKALVQVEASERKTKSPATVKAQTYQPPVMTQRKRFNPFIAIVPVVVIAAVAGIFFLRGIASPAVTEAPSSTPTSAPVITETSEPVDTSTEVPIAILEATATEAPPTPTETPAAPVLPAFGGADRIAFVANSEIWLMNLDGSELAQLTTDGGLKSDLQWLPDGRTFIFISGKTVKFYDIETGVVDTLASFPSAATLDAFRLSHDGSQAMVSMNNEIFVVPFDFNTMKGVSKKSDLLALGPCIQPKGKTRSALIVKEARWSADNKLVAWLFKGPDAGNPSLQSDQVSILNIQDCNPDTIDMLDNFPGNRFIPVEFQNHLMPDFDWDGFNLFVFHTSKRNNGWGELYIYDWESHKPTHIRPISGKCCYRDVRWSPDGTYLIFAFQDEGLAGAAPTLLYYVPYGGIGTGAKLTSIPLPEGFFKNPKEAPQPALHPAQ